MKAAERDTSVSALVRDYLVSFAIEESDFERKKRLQDQVISTITSFRAEDRLTRDEVHNRDALR